MSEQNKKLDKAAVAREARRKARGACMWCGKTLAEHEEAKANNSEYVHQGPKMPCLTLKKRFTPGEKIKITPADEVCGKCKKPKAKEIEVELPIEPEIERRALIDLEDNVGVIMPQVGRKVKVMRYEGTYCKCGRPTDYTPELLEKAREYRDVKMPFEAEDGIQEIVHSIEGLASYIKVNRETVRVWAKDSDKEEFSGIVSEILEKQARMLISKGLGAIFSGPITKLMLTKHGYRDVVDNFNRDVPVDPATKKISDDAIDEFLKDNKQ